MSETNAKVDAFIGDEVRAMAPLFAQRFAQQLQKKGKVASGDLLRSMVSKAVGLREIQAAFLRYGRFVDMGAQPGWRKGVYVGKGRPGQRPRKTIFYSRVKMGLYGQLVSNLSNKYVDALYEQAVHEMTEPHGR